MTDLPNPAIPPLEPLPLGRADLSHLRPAAVGRFRYGVCYYPEHWDEATCEHDAEWMEAAGFNTVRMAEFAWDLLEPEEGRYEFGLFDRVIDRLYQRGLQTILGTPTAAPPRWLTVRYPEVLRRDASGVALSHGSRQHACLSSPIFRKYSQAITAAMAEHFRNCEAVAGWQTDNEIYCHFVDDHNADTERSFQQYLHLKYAGQIGELNRRWGTAFWAQTYRSFGEIPTPRDGRPTYLNPAHALDYARFLSWEAASFQHEQVAILRQANPRWFVMHNGVMRKIDYRGLFSRDLDFLGYDVYPMFVHQPATRAHCQAYGLDETRGMAGNFMVPEHQAGAGGQPPYFHNQPEPGEMRKMAWVSIARGADSLLFFRWRSCRFGAEQYWLGLIDHDNIPRRRYAEATWLGEELKTVGPAVLNTSVAVDCAVAAGDFEVRESHLTYSLGLPAPAQIGAEAHRVLWEQGLSVGCVHPEDDLSAIRLYIIPHWTLFRQEWALALEKWVEAGGVLVIGARTGSRDEDNNIVPQPLPGCLRELAGITVIEYGRLNGEGGRLPHLKIGETSLPARDWYEVLEPSPCAETVAVWEKDYPAGTTALTRRRQGRGWVYYVGTYLSAGLVAALLPEWRTLAKLEPAWPHAPAGVETVRRRGASGNVWFFINHREAAVELPTTPEGVNLLTGQPVGAQPLLLPRHGVAVIAT